MTSDTPRRHLYAVPTPKPPSERGWRGEHGPELPPPIRRGWFRMRLHPTIEIPIGLFADAVNQLRTQDHLADWRAVDRTFENETRPLR